MVHDGQYQTLLNGASAADSVMPSEAGLSTRYLTATDVRHKQNNRIQTILDEIRAMPGLERFMLGRTYEQLRSAARKHPVVLLAAARGHARALIVPTATEGDPHLFHLAVTSDRLSWLRDAAGQAGLRSGPVGDDSETNARLVVHIEDALAVMAGLWKDIVRPVLNHLQLQVCIHRHLAR
jgi:hypothetical protein